MLGSGNDSRGALWRTGSNLKILIIDTAYWGIIRAAGLDKQNLDLASKDHLVESFCESSPSSGPSLVRALRARGHSVNLHIANAPGFNSIPTRSPKGLLKPSANFFWKRWQLVSRIPVIGDVLFSRCTLATEMLEVAKRGSFDLIYILNPNLSTPRISRELRKHTRFMVGQIASPLPPDSFFSNYQLMVSAHPGQVEYFKSLGIKSVYFPLAINEAILPETLMPHDEREIDICFVGNFSRHHRSGTRMLQSLCREFPQIRIYSLTSKARLKRLGLINNYAGVVWGSEMMRLYSRSRMVINRHGEVAGGFAVNYRLFEATGAGAMLFTEAAPNLADLLEPGIEVETYRDFAELSQKLRRALSDNGWTESVGFAGAEAVRRNHTTEIRYTALAELLEGMQ